MKPISIFVAAAAVLLLVSACSTSNPSTATASSTIAPTGASAPGSPPGSFRASSTAQTTGGGGDPAAFCSKLSAGADKAAALMAAVGTPDQAAKLAEVKADNDAILASAPADVHDPIAKFYEVSDLGRKALDPSLSAAEKRAAASEASAAIAKPETKAAIANYKNWVQTNCASLASKILAGA